MTPWEKHEKEQAERELSQRAEALLPSKEFDETLFSHAEYMRKEILNGKSESVMPRAIILLDRDEGKDERGVAMVAMADMPPTHDGRAEMMACVGAHFAQQKMRPVAILLITEAWASKCDKNGKMPSCLPSDNPDRKEVLMLSGATIDGRQNTLMLPITRDVDNVILLGEADISYLAGAPSKEQEARPFNFLAAAFFQGFAIGSVMGMGGCEPGCECEGEGE